MNIFKSHGGEGSRGSDAGHPGDRLRPGVPRRPRRARGRGRDRCGARASRSASSTSPATACRRTIVDAAFAGLARVPRHAAGRKAGASRSTRTISATSPVNESIQGASTVHKATRPNLNESFFISHDRGADHPDVVAGTPLRGRNQWPDGHDRMRARHDAVLHDARGASASGCCPCWPARSTCPRMPSRPFFADEAHVNLRFLHYPPQETDDDEQFGQGPHTDNSFITILAREDVPGSPSGCRAASGWRRRSSRGPSSSTSAT